MALRKINFSDLPMIYKWRNDPMVRQHMYSSHKISLLEHLYWYLCISMSSKSVFLIHLDKNRKPDGVSYFKFHDRDKRSAFWGFYKAPNVKKGAGMEIGVDSLNYAFLSLGLRKLNSECFASNDKSVILHKRLGFKREGLFRDYHQDNGALIDVMRFGMIAAEWHDLNVNSERAENKPGKCANSV
jgi:UDP-4-amino-4,6-dideoxy-N-acetyl-beta-L-altrosamine N-acetyltransferase